MRSCFKEYKLVSDQPEATLRNHTTGANDKLVVTADEIAADAVPVTTATLPRSEPYVPRQVVALPLWAVVPFQHSGIRSLEFT